MSVRESCPGRLILLPSGCFFFFQFSIPYFGSLGVPIGSCFFSKLPTLTSHFSQTLKVPSLKILWPPWTSNSLTSFFFKLLSTCLLSLLSHSNVPLADASPSIFCLTWMHTFLSQTSLTFTCFSQTFLIYIFSWIFKLLAQTCLFKKEWHMLLANDVRSVQNAILILNAAYMILCAKCSYQHLTHIGR